VRDLNQRPCEAESRCAMFQCMLAASSNMNSNLNILFAMTCLLHSLFSDW
jgi:hypothetical protein